MPYFWYQLKFENGLRILAFRSLNENTIHWLFHEKLFKILVVAFKALDYTCISANDFPF